MTHIDPMDILLGELDTDGRRSAEDRLARDPALRAEVEAMRPLVDALEALPDEAWDPPVPPPLRHPDADAAPAPVRKRTGRRRSGGGVPWWRRALVPMPALGLAAVVALAAGIGVGALVVGGDDRPDTVADLQLASFGDAPDVAGGEARILEGRQLSLAVRDLAPSGGDEFYSAWLLGADGRLVPLGSFRVPASGAADVRLPLPVDPSEFDFVDVSIEPDDGDPGHSGRSVLRGPTA